MVLRRRKRHEAQRAILQAIVDLAQERGYPPTYREIADRVGLVHSAVYVHVRALVDAGMLLEDRATARTLRVTPDGCQLLISAQDVGSEV